AERCQRMRGPERVVRRFVAARESRRSAPLAQLVHLCATAGEDLVRVSLMPDVPDDAIARRIENVMQRDRQLDGTEVRRQMTACLRHRIQYERAQLARELRQPAALQATELGGISDRFEQWK